MNDLARVAVSQRDEPFHTSQPARTRAKGKALAMDGSICGPVANETAEIFQSHRARLFGLAYRMLGSRAEAEDLLQDAYLRWHQSSTQDIQSPVAFLVTVTTRLCLDRLRQLKHEREHYIGPWLPEPIVEEELPSPEMQLERTDEISVAFLAVLERLGPEERAAFLLHDVFDHDYPEVAKMVGKSEPTCRQMIHRARARVRDSRPRFSVTAETRERVLGKFLAAVKTGERQAVMALLAENVEYMATGGGKVIAALKILCGPERIGRLTLRAVTTAAVEPSWNQK